MSCEHVMVANLADHRSNLRDQLTMLSIYWTSSRSSACTIIWLPGDAAATFKDVSLDCIKPHAPILGSHTIRPPQPYKTSIRTPQLWYNS